MFRGVVTMHSKAELRGERRTPMSLAVRIEENEVRGWSERTYTDNVNSRGARVLTVRAWKPNETVRLTARAASFATRARVAYCQALADRGFAIGLEFLDPNGDWVVSGHS